MKNGWHGNMKAIYGNYPSMNKGTVIQRPSIQFLQDTVD